MDVSWPERLRREVGVDLEGAADYIEKLEAVASAAVRIDYWLWQVDVPWVELTREEKSAMDQVSYELNESLKRLGPNSASEEADTEKT